MKPRKFSEILNNPTTAEALPNKQWKDIAAMVWGSAPEDKAWGVETQVFKEYVKQNNIILPTSLINKIIV